MASRLPVEQIAPDMLMALYVRQYPDLVLLMDDIANLPDLSPAERHRKILDSVRLYEMSVINRGRQTILPRLQT